MKGIYIVKFDIYPGLYKIGKSKDIEERINGFKKSEIMLGNVELCYSKEFEDHTKAEKDIHKLLENYRCKDNKEFFKGNLKEFIDVIEALDSDNYKEKEKKNKNITVSEEALEYIQKEINRQNDSEYSKYCIEKLTVIEGKIINLLGNQIYRTDTLSNCFDRLLNCITTLTNKVFELECEIEKLKSKV